MIFFYRGGEERMIGDAFYNQLIVYSKIFPGVTVESKEF